MELPVYELRIDEEMNSVVDAIALVENPAIESEFIAFSKEQSHFTFSKNDEKMELLGAAMIPDMRIYREDENHKGYYVFFSKETIRNVAQVFFKHGFQDNMNLDHDKALDASSFIFQSYIVDQGKGMTSPIGLNLPDGTWVVGVKVTDKAIWSDIMSGKRKGFSIEGIFERFQSTFHEAKKRSDEEELMEAFQKINSLLIKM